MQAKFSNHLLHIADYFYWQKQDGRMARRINKLIAEVRRGPFSSAGKPEPLKHTLSGYWSERINNAHEMVYKIEGDCSLLAQLAYHC